MYWTLCIKCVIQYLSAWNNYKFAIDHFVLMPKYRMKAQEIAKSEGLLDSKKKKDKTKTKVLYSVSLLCCRVAFLNNSVNSWYM